MDIAVIGQKKLVALLDGYTLQTLPHALMLVGEYGCGKHLLMHRLANKLSLDVIELTNETTPEQLIEYYQYPLPRMYFVDLTKATEKQQNAFLKFVEEPSDNSYVVVLAESDAGILPTLANRCKKLRFEPYSKQELAEFSWAVDNQTDLIYDICHTPGQLLDVDAKSVQKAYDLCNTIVEKAKLATFPNTIKLCTKINCKDNFDRIDFELFFKMLAYVAHKKYIETNDEFAFRLYLYLVDAKAKRLNKSVAKESYVLSFLSDLWRLSR